MIKKNLIRIWIVVMIACVMCFSDWSFAEYGEQLEDLWMGLNYIVSVLSWSWILFAKLAWTFLTNKWVYGWILWWDVLLWRFWNVVKNIANFGLWFYFVYEIFKGFIDFKRQITDNLKKKILWLLVAWVWIQASWFLTAVVVDVSTITLSAAGAFPEQVISDNSFVQEKIKQNLDEYLTGSKGQRNQPMVVNGEEISVFPKSEGVSEFVDVNKVKLEDPKRFEDLVSALMPNPDNISWPLYYLWLSILKSTNCVPSLVTDENAGAKKMIFAILINGWTTVIFAIEMIVLCILALMRLLYLWMFIILSPLAVLLECIKRSSWNLWTQGDSFVSKLMKQINLKSFFINVFKPTIIVLWFWVAILFATLMKGVVNDSVWRPTTVGSVEFSDTTMDSNLVEFTLLNAWKPILEIILSIITVLLVYFIIKFAVQMWKWDDFVSKRIWEVQKVFGEALSSLPLLPVAWYDKDGVKTTHWIWAKDVFDVTSWKSNVLRQWIEYRQRDITDEYNEQVGLVDSLFNNKNNKSYLTSKEKQDIDDAIWISTIKYNGLGEVKEKIKGKNKCMTLDGSSSSSQYWVEAFKRWLDGITQDLTKKSQFLSSLSNSKDKKGWDGIFRGWKSAKGDLSKVLNTQYAIEAYLGFFLGDDGYEGVRDWPGLSHIDISMSQSGSK